MTALDIAPLLLLLGLVAGSILVVYLLAGVYFRWKENAFWSRADDIANELMTDEERAAWELWSLPEGSTIEFTDPEGDPATDNDPADIAKDVAEMKQLQMERDRRDRSQRLDYDRIPTGEVFTDLNGKKYKFVDNPVYSPDYNPNVPKRSKISVGGAVGGAVGNANAIPFPTHKELETITKRQSIETALNTDGNMLDVEPEDGAVCELCGIGTDHNHNDGEVRRYIFERAEASFKTYVANLDLTKLPVEDVERLWARCKLRIETDATLSALVEMDRFFSRAQKLAAEDAEDEEYYRKVCKEEPKQLFVSAPAVLDSKPESCGFEVPGFAPCTRAYGHEGPCALPRYTKYCGNCEDLFPEDRAVENCGCGFEIDKNAPTFTPDEEEGEAPKQPQPIDMPKRFMSAITHQIAEEEVTNGVLAFGRELVEEVVEEDEHHKVWAGIGQLMRKLQEPEPRSKRELVEKYDHLTDSELATRVQALLQVAQKRAAVSESAAREFKASKPSKKKPRKK